MGMTNAAHTHSIPAEGLRHEAGDTVWTLNTVGCGGYSLNIRTNGAKTGGDWFQFSTNALNAWNAIADANPVEVVEPAPVRTLPAPAKGTATKVSDPAHTILAVAALNGFVQRGGQPGQGDVRLLTSLAKRGYLALQYETGRSDLRKVVVGATITRAGRVRLAELTAADREAAERAAAIAHVLAYAA
jgi:hypothetical protein